MECIYKCLVLLFLVICSIYILTSWFSLLGSLRKWSIKLLQNYESESSCCASFGSDNSFKFFTIDQVKVVTNFIFFFVFELVGVQ